MDNELFELCEQVCEKTRWDEGELYCLQDGNIPLYNSDYLLEKLPSALWIEVSGEGKQVALLTINMQGNGEAVAVYALPYDTGFRGAYSKRADTPLKALLKLVLALKEAGEI